MNDPLWREESTQDSLSSPFLSSIIQNWQVKPFSSEKKKKKKSSWAWDVSVIMRDLLYSANKRARVLPGAKVLPGARVLREESASLSPKLGLLMPSRWMQRQALTPESYINEIDENWVNCFSIKFVKRQRQNRRELFYFLFLSVYISNFSCYKVTYIC